MENTHDHRNEPVNDAQHQRNHWQTDASAEETRRAMKSDDPEDKDEDGDEEDHVLPEWGDVDPLDGPGPSGPMDPTGPGSAV